MKKKAFVSLLLALTLALSAVVYAGELCTRCHNPVHSGWKCPDPDGWGE